MARGLQGLILRGMGARDHAATVIEAIGIAPHFVRVRMESPTLFDDVKAEPAAWLRFWFPDPNGSNTEFQRAYTISEADVLSGRFAVDVVLHEPAGPASLSSHASGTRPYWPLPVTPCTWIIPLWPRIGRSPGRRWRLRARGGRAPSPSRCLPPAGG